MNRLITAVSKLRKLTIVCLCIISVNALAQPLQNQLKDHAAPYLALHGDDPVAWQPWGESAVEYARQHNKILFLSIGYFACHWCHVMQQESYKNKEIAAFINQHFVAVKIDRELQPALDRRLMDFTQRIIGRGGWPLNVFVAPNGHPVYSLLYAPPEQFMQVLQKMQAVWQADPEQVLKLISDEGEKPFADKPAELDSGRFLKILNDASKSIMNRADLLSGGFGEQQKFPSVPQLQFLLKEYSRNADQEIQEFLNRTLSAMASNGLNDHLAGGFFRYSVDPQWEIPHFEKMLYDNANMSSLYLHAARVFDDQAYAEVARITLDFMQREMWHENGALVSSFSAVDDDQIEGGSYLWKKEEVTALLSSEQADLVFAIWQLDRRPELSRGNHIRYAMSLGQYAQQNNLELDQVYIDFEEVREKLLDARALRSLPVDDKLLAGWNGLALKAFVQGAGYFPQSSYADTARALRDFLVTKLWDGKTLSRSSAKGNLIGAASLEDYAYVSNALQHWAVFSNSAEDFEIARDIAVQGWNKFHRQNGWYQGDDTLLAPVSGQEMIADAASPSPSAMLISTSLALAERFSDDGLRAKALSALNRSEQTLTRAPYWFVSQLDAIDQDIRRENLPTQD